MCGMAGVCSGDCGAVERVKRSTADSTDKNGLSAITHGLEQRLSGLALSIRLILFYPRNPRSSRYFVVGAWVSRFL